MIKKAALFFIVTLVIAMTFVACKTDNVIIICNNCAAEIAENSQYCSNCGTQLVESIGTTAAATIDTTIPTESTPDATEDNAPDSPQGTPENTTAENTTNGTTSTNLDHQESTKKENSSVNNTTSTMSFQTLVSRFSGKWYLEGYANVYLDFKTDSDGWLLIYTNNYFMPDDAVGREDGIVYPFLSGITDREYCIGASIPPVYDWKQHTDGSRLVFSNDCIYSGSYKFVRTPGLIEKIFCLSHHWNNPTCQLPSTCKHCGYTEGSPIECQYINGVCHFCGGLSSESPSTEPSTTEPPTTELPITNPFESIPPNNTEPPETEPIETAHPAIEQLTDVLIIRGTYTISDQTINTDVYITSTGVATFSNVTINGNIYCYGQLKCSGCTANNVYAYAYGSMMSCPSFDGTHGKVSGGIDCNKLSILDDSLDYAFNKWGKK